MCLNKNNLNKKLRVFFLTMGTFMCVPSFAMRATTERVVVENNASSVSRCFLDSRQVAYAEDESVYKVFLSGNKEANLNFSFEIQENQLPLKEGEVKTPYLNTKAWYKKGVLRFVKVDSGDVEKEVTTVLIETDANFKNPTQAYAKIEYTGKTSEFPFYVRNQLVKSIKCDF